MRASIRGQPFSGCHQRHWLPHSNAPLLALWWILPAFATAQQVNGPPSPFSSFQTEPSAAATSSPSSPSENPTAVGTASESPQTQPSLAQHTNTSNSDSSNKNDNLLNLYFLFIAIIVVILLLGLWLLHRRKKRIKERSRGRAQDALARDMNGWVNTRRWIHGNRRPGGEEGLTQREEGLNENGEAPPPYEPPSHSGHDPTAPAPVTTEGAPQVDWSSSPAGVAVPMQTLSTDGRTAPKPPDYQETIRSTSEGGDRPLTSAGASTTELARPPAAQRPEH
ncbi:hypothetical protein K490DRAFT_61412 [Saccharata proteae CBS 121410]|uniref:Uncharacterized protein n=1 Tax=Saccharata proteae CBS 121410 TaxID=1314787 RepID=A0A9P4I1R9_9PEZI|nr:hypothetical protein K490DRAFT_61412 [Saccharata proteae CBS 121410]